MDYEEEYRKLRDLLERFYIAASSIDSEFCSPHGMTGEVYEKHSDVFIEVEEYLGI